MDPTPPPKSPNLSISNNSQTTGASLPIPPSPTVYSDSSGGVAAPIQTTSRPHLKFILIILAIVLFLTIATSAVLAGIAYEKIDIKNPGLERKITHFIMGLPFTPKTPRYLLESAALAHTKVSKHSFDISLALKSNGVTSGLNLNQVDVEAKGNVDYSDQKNIKVAANASITKDFNIYIAKNSAILYVKVNKIPDIVFTYLGVDKTKVLPVLDNWIAIDTSQLETQARQELEKKEENKSLTEQYIANLVEDLADKQLLPQLKVVQETLDGKSVDKISLTADDKTLDSLIYKIQNRLEENTKKTELKVNSSDTKPSDYIKNFTMDIYVDSGNYLVRKVVNSFDYQQPNNFGETTKSRVLGTQTPGNAMEMILGIGNTPTGQLTQVGLPGMSSFGADKFSVASVVKFDNFGESFSIEVPSSSIKPEDFYQKIMEASGFGSQLSATQASARDAMRKSDLKSLSIALELYKQKNGKYPETLKSLETMYINKIPVDPGTKQSYEYKPNAAKTAFTLRAKLEDETIYQINEKN